MKGRLFEKVAVVMVVVVMLGGVPRTNASWLQRLSLFGGPDGTAELTPGGANNELAEFPPRASGSCKGSCFDIENEEQADLCSRRSGLVLTGKCPGPSNIKCCRLPKANDSPKGPGKCTDFPSFEAMEQHYPMGNSSEAKAIMGGYANFAWIKNTCALRLSYALTLAGCPLPTLPGSYSGHSGTNTIRDGRRHLLAYRVVALRKYFENTVGKADLKLVPKSGPKGVDRSQILGRHAIILFRIPTFSSASGHADIWDGTKMISTGHRDPSTVDWYFAHASRVDVWLVE